MRKDEFMERLEKSLVMDGPEKTEVLNYYSEYLTEAGEDKEETVIEEIGSPEELGNRLSAEFLKENTAEEQNKTAEPKEEADNDSIEDMVRDIGSSVEKFLKKLFKNSGDVLEDVTERMETEWKKSEPIRKDVANEVSKAVDEARKAVKQAAKEGNRQGKKVYTSLKDILNDTGLHAWEYTNFDLEPFHNIRVAVKNCPIYLHRSENGCYGADVRLYIRGEDAVTAGVQDDTLVIEGVGSRAAAPVYSGNTAGFGGQAVNLYLPDGVYESVQLSTSNARIDASDVQLHDCAMECRTGNGRVELNGCVIGKRVKAVTSNSAVLLSNVTADEAVLVTCNAQVKVTDSDLGILEAATSNGPVVVDGCGVSKKLQAETSNGAIRMVLPLAESEYRITADTSNADVIINNRRLGDMYRSNGRIPLKANTGNGRISLSFSQPKVIYEAEEPAEE